MMDNIQINRIDGHQPNHCDLCDEALSANGERVAITTPICCQKSYHAECFMPRLAGMLDAIWPEQDADGYKELKCPGCLNPVFLNNFLN